jgi:hypothetical protein
MVGRHEWAAAHSRGLTEGAEGAGRPGTAGKDGGQRMGKKRGRSWRLNKP